MKSYETDKNCLKLMNHEVGQYIKVIKSAATVCQIMNINDILTFRSNESATGCTHSKTGFDIFNKLS